MPTLPGQQYDGPFTLVTALEASTPVLAVGAKGPYILRNMDTAKVIYLQRGAAAASATGYPLQPGCEIPIYTSQAVNACVAAGSTSAVLGLWPGDCVHGSGSAVTGTVTATTTDSATQILVRTALVSLGMLDPECLYVCPQNFTGTRSGATTMLVAGLPFDPADYRAFHAVISLKAGQVEAVYTPQSHVMAWASTGGGGGTLTITGASMDAAAILIAVVVGPKRAYSATTDAHAVAEIDPPERDVVQNAEVVIDARHWETHAGQSYVTTDYDADVDIGGPKYWKLTTPNSAVRCHAILDAIIGGSGGRVELYENPTVNVAGSALTVRNRDRNSVNTATLAATYDDTSTADGTLVWVGFIGAAGVVAMDEEFILKANEEYFIKLTATADNTPVWLVVSHYEE